MSTSSSSRRTKPKATRKIKDGPVAPIRDRSKIEVLEPQLEPIKIMKNKRRLLIDNPKNARFQMQLYASRPIASRTYADTALFFYRWLALNKGKQMHEKCAKLLLYSEAMERAKFKNKKRIRFAVDLHPEMLKRPSNK